MLSDVLGLSMQVVGINHPRPDGATAATVFGPFFVEGAPAYQNGDDLAAGAPGQPCWMQGRILSPEGDPIAGALIDVWQADEDGLYDVQVPDLDAARGRGQLRSAADGRYWFWSVLPEPYPIPANGPVGELLAASGRSPMRPAHVHFKVAAPGYETLITHVFVEGDPYLDADAVFGVKRSLITPFQRQGAGVQTPDGRDVAGPWYAMDYAIVLTRRPDSRADG